MKNPLLKLDDVSRRAFLEQTAKSALGVSLLSAGTLSAGALAAPSRTISSGPGKAKQVIYLMMSGGMSHLDTFDLKPGREIQGETKGIKTNVPGIQIGERLPSLAKQMDKIAVVNSVNQTTAAHGPARYRMRTSYKVIATTRHPAMGAWAQRVQGKRLKELPDNVLVNGEAQHPGAGFLKPEFTPLPIGNADDGLQNTQRPEYVTNAMFRRRLKLVSEFDASFQKKYKQRQVAAYNDFYEQATALLTSDDLKAFDIKQEKEEVREKYGINNFGQGVLLARRLVERKVRFIEVTMGGWDHHRDIYSDTGFPSKAAILDQALAALLTDLKESGLLNETLVVLTSEFGRTPKISQNAGRDHHPVVFSGCFAGGGIQGGQVYGKSDEDGFYVEEDGVDHEDFNATIAYGLGLPLDEEFHSPTGRPFKVAHDGDPVKKLFG